MNESSFGLDKDIWEHQYLSLLTITDSKSEFSKGLRFSREQKGEANEEKLTHSVLKERRAKHKDLSSICHHVRNCYQHYFQELGWKKNRELIFCPELKAGIDITV